MTSRLPRPPDPIGATPLTSEDLQGLIPTDVATRGDLDLAELENILDARAWAAGRTWKPEGLLDSYALAGHCGRGPTKLWSASMRNFSRLSTSSRLSGQRYRKYASRRRTAMRAS